MEINKAALGHRIKQARTHRNLTGEKLAEKCNIHPTYIRQIETGTRIPSLPMFVSLCNELGVSPHTLLIDSLNHETLNGPSELADMMREATPAQMDVILGIPRGALDVLLTQQSPDEE